MGFRGKLEDRSGPVEEAKSRENFRPISFACPLKVRSLEGEPTRGPLPCERPSVSVKSESREWHRFGFSRDTAEVLVVRTRKRARASVLPGPTLDGTRRLGCSARLNRARCSEDEIATAVGRCRMYPRLGI